MNYTVVGISDLDLAFKCHLGSFMITVNDPGGARSISTTIQ